MKLLIIPKFIECVSIDVFKNAAYLADKTSIGVFASLNAVLSSFFAKKSSQLIVVEMQH